MANVADPKGVVVTCPSCGQRNRVAFTRLNAKTTCGKCATVLGLIAEPVDVPSSAVFDALVEASPIPVVVDFWAPWCGPCRMVAPELATVARAHAGEYLVVKVNTDEVAELAERFAIRSIPMMSVFVGGRQAATVVGVRPASEIEAFVKGALPPS